MSERTAIEVEGRGGLARVLGRPAHTYLLKPPAAFAAKYPALTGVKVYLDGKYKGQVSLYKTGAGVGRLLAWQSGTLTLGKHTIKLIVAGTAGHPRVDLDAFIVMK